jgi:Bacterial Ig-like domain (group 2)/Divergent InlB B-repeat domain
MSRKRYRLFAVAFALGCLAGLPSCGHDQELVGITVQPNTETFGAASVPVSADAGLNVQLRALGSYIHPPVTKDITDQVTWSSNTPNMVTVNSTGLIVATGNECGDTIVSATVTTNHSSGNLPSSGALVTGNMTANVVCFTGSGGGGPSLTVNFPGPGSGSITSSPPGLSCASTCTASLASGTTITLTATASGSSSFASWGNCDTVSGQACTVDNLTSDRVVTVTFN